MKKQYIILKADDFSLIKSRLIFSNNIISKRWLKFIRIVNTYHIKADLGIIGKSLEGNNKRFNSMMQQILEQRCFEFWNHGYNHEMNEEYCEFSNTTVEYQLEHLQLTQEIAKKKFGIVLNTFGAPGNAIDQNTITALEQIPEIKIWFFGNVKSNKLVLPRYCDIEYPCGYPDYNKFINNINLNSSKDLLVLQIHPNNWNDNSFAEFEKIIRFLTQNEEVEFINAYEYYKSVNVVEE